jgi:hypothetical protein
LRPELTRRGERSSRRVGAFDGAAQEGPVEEAVEGAKLGSHVFEWLTAEAVKATCFGDLRRVAQW